MRLWQASCIASGAQGRAIYKIPYGDNANIFAQPARAPTLGATVSARTHKRARQALDVPDSFAKSGPYAKALLPAAGGNTPEVTRNILPDLGAH